MPSAHDRRPIVRVVAGALALAGTVVCAALVVVPATSPAAEADGAFVVTVDHPSVKVGERAVIVATIAAREGFKVTDSYRHKLRRVTALDDGVRVESKIVNGAVRDGKVVFLVDVVPTKVGTHSVVGIFRFSVHNGQQLDIKSAPFEATVTGTE